MKTYYVATLARYVLVEADNETRARELGLAALRAICADEAPINIRIVRLATDDEVQMCNWHDEMVAHESNDSP